MSNASDLLAPAIAQSAPLVPPDRELLLNGPFIDLRAPVEFERGALPGAVNLPLMTDDERAQVGTTYAEQGQEAAIALGHELVSGAVRAERLAGWAGFLEAHPSAYLYCARGGLRSEIVQRWLAEEGLTVTRIAGGFKAIRQLCLDVLAEAPGAKPWLIVGGRTGCGKTRLLADIAGSIDLEALANHRSSAFGEYDTPQPPQIGFENALALACVAHVGKTVVLEDESRSIGHVALPLEWYEAMRASPLLVLESEMPDRCRHIADEYVNEPMRRGKTAAAVLDRLSRAVDRIQRKLGPERHAEIQSWLRKAFDDGDHQPWIERLLTWYYDPLYDRNLARKAEQVVWRGPREDAPQAIASLSGTA